MFTRNPVSGAGARARTMLALLAVLVVFSSLSPPLTGPAKAQEAAPEGLTEVGPVNPETGYPYWLKDANGIKLDLCLDPQDQMCLQPFEMPNPDEPVTFPDNFPGESFWFAGDASMPTSNGGEAQLVLATEAAFGGREEVRSGDQMAFGRVRIRVDDLQIGEEYKVTHPYGTDTFIAEDDGKGAGEINATEDLGCAGGALAECKWDELVVGKNRVGPFLTWDEGAPEGYVGDPNQPHTVTGSPYDTNYFKIEGPNVGGEGVNSIETEEFNVSGKLAAQQATASAQGDTYNAAQEIEIVASDPEAQVYYTTASSDPESPDYVSDEDLQTAGTPYAPGEKIFIEQDSDLRFQAFKDGEEPSKLYTESYEIDLEAPHVTATPEPVLYEPLEQPQDVTLQTNEAATIYYTTDGSDPRDPDNEAVQETSFDPATPESASHINVARSQTIKAFAEDADSNQSRTESFDYKVASLAEVGPVNPEHGYPEWLADANGTKLELCLDPQDQMCLQPFESPNPDQPVTFPDNFPGESFWFAGDARMATNGGGDARLTMASEAAFAADQVRPEEQIGFGRVRIRVDNLVAGEEYKITHPYGTDTLVAEDNGRTGNRQAGEINFTEDIGCMMPSTPDGCNYEEMRYSRVGPFLKWDEGAPNGYVGDPAIDHKVTGSPTGDNFFRIEGPDVGGAGEDEIQTDLFSVSGKLAGLNAAPSVEGGAFNEDQQVALTADDPNATIVFTTDGTDPTVSQGGTGDAAVAPALLNLFAALDSGTTITNGEEYKEPIAISRDTDLRYIVVNGSNVSKVYSQKYTFDREAPTVSANPKADTYQEAQDVKLESSEDGKIHYTTDGSEPTTESKLFEGPIKVDKTQTIKAIAVDKAGNRSQVESFEYTIEEPAVAAQTDLTLDTSRSSLTFGQLTTLSGKLASDGNALAGKRVTIEHRPVGAKSFTKVPNQPATGLMTRDDGGFRLTGVKPAKNTIYRATFSGNEEFEKSLSATKRVNVKAVVTNATQAKQIKVNQAKVISGQVRPSHTGTVKVTVKKGAKVVLRKNVRLNSSSYRFVYRPKAAGVYTVQVTMPTHADHLAGTSPAKKFRTIR